MNAINKLVARTARLAMLVLIVAAAVAQAQALDGAGDGDHAADTPSRVIADFRHLSKINPAVIKEFEKAWKISRNGTSDSEGVVLIFRTIDGGYKGLSLGASNESRKFTFKWDPAAIAIVHTHPNSSGPRPSQQDKQVAERHNVPIFTITLTGMYAYNPATRMTRQVMDGLDWLKPAGWRKANAKLKDSGVRSLAAGY